MSDYERGYQDGLEAGREANKSGPVLGGVEMVIDELCIPFSGESDEYQRGFRQGIRDSL